MIVEGHAPSWPGTTDAMKRIPPEERMIPGKSDVTEHVPPKQKKDFHGGPCLIMAP